MSASPDIAEDGATVTLWWLQRELGCTGYAEPRLIRYVSALIANADFPPPLPRLLRGRKGEADGLAATVGRDSRWRRAPVEAWLADLLPPPNTAQVDIQAQRAAAAEMDAAAGHLFLVAGGRA